MIFKKLNDYIYNDELDIRQRMFVINIINFTGVLAITTLEMLISGAYWLQCLVMFILIIIVDIVTYTSITKNHVNRGSVIISAIMCFCVFPLEFFNGGGISGTGPMWFVFNILFVSIMLKGKARMIFAAAEEIIGLGCYLVSFYNPGLVTEIKGIKQYIYSFTALLLISISISVLVSIENTLYIKQTERTNRQSKEIESLVASQNRFFSSMSHEIRTPINTIIGLNEMILREDISDEIAEDAANIRSAGKMLLNTINDILDMSKFQSGDMHLLLENYNTGDMLSDLVGMLWIKAKDKNLDFRIKVAPDVPATLNGDEVRIKQILVNILNNAIKYTKEGSVSLSIECEKKEDNLCNMIYTVEDTGMGIKKEDIPYLFTAFKRVDESSNKHIEGTGLGLSIVKQLLDLMGGKVTVNSVYTKGSTFIIEIPQKAASEQEIGNYDYEKRHKLEKRPVYKKKFEAPEAKLLVVDDNDSNLMVVAKLLRETKIQIDTVKSGREALKKTLEKEYNLIFMDHLMPEMDGIECFNAIRKQVGGKCKETNIVILTANAGEENRALYARTGFNGYLIKPVSGADLESEVIRQLPRELVVLTETIDDSEDAVTWTDDNIRKRKVAITSESINDIPQALLNKYEIATLPHKIETAEGIFKEGIEIDSPGILKYMSTSDGMVTSKNPTIEEYEDFFAKQLTKANYIIHITPSSLAENSSYEVAVKAANSFDNVIIYDSQNISSGSGMIAIVASRMAEAGMDYNEIIARLEKYKLRVRTSFMIDNMDYFARAKYISQTYANFTKALLLRPVILVKNGKITTGRTKLGSTRRVWTQYINSNLSSGKYETAALFIVHIGLGKKELAWIKALVESRFSFEQIIFLQASPSLASVMGPGTFGMMMVEKIGQ